MALNKEIDEDIVVNLEEILEEFHQTLDEKVEEEIAEITNKQGSLDKSLVSQESKAAEKIEEVKQGFTLLLQDLKEAVRILEEESATLAKDEGDSIREECLRLKELLKKERVFITKGGDDQIPLYKKFNISWPFIQSFYTVAHQLFDQGRSKEAASIFEMLALLSPKSYV